VRFLTAGRGAASAPLPVLLAEGIVARSTAGCGPGAIGRHFRSTRLARHRNYVKRGNARRRRPVSRVLFPAVRRGDDHFSRTPVTRRLQRPDPRARAGHPIALLFGLAPGGVYLADAVTRTAGELLPHRFTLTALESGGLFSVALSVGLPPLGVTQHPALWSPDFPPATLPWPAIAQPSPTRPLSIPARLALRRRPASPL
jgi:hypothetical protein